MSGLRLPRQLGEMTKNYRFVKDTAGMSPARVYRLIGPHENLYLKISDRRYQGTTYDVEREKDIMLWLQGKLPVPEVLHFEADEDEKFLLMREAIGDAGYAYYEKQRDPKQMIRIYSEGIKLLQAIDVFDCPFVSDIDYRLNELDYLLRHNLADTDTGNWEEDTPFRDPNELYAFLKMHKPGEELVFSHGDFGDGNIFIMNHQISGFIDLGRSGKADKWCDIALCVRSIQHDMGNDEEYLELFFELLDLEPDWDKIRYHVLLDELF
ncbi:APH(3') family aminoglycoside O-phosphotransferase [uncultured Chloroflexus sp.]|uniref:APH(3') family aminoglycoside O-phosphotransferase n=1 Tax=uncultured Chloroflexus sp. TaxID=214040 RepID=UPI0026133B3A|nr:APH(3') family aminoglycoside O-phosphotransferase [uncultured Chloroflexus sp.]